VPHVYEWSVLRAVPRVERCEFVNVGVLVYCQMLDALLCKVTDDLSRVSALDPQADLDAIRRHLEGIERVCRGDAAGGEAAQRPLGERFRWLIAPRSTVVQTSPVHTGMTDDPAAELADLVARMVEPPR
jgi:Protein of unknown function (DUF3037)